MIFICKKRFLVLLVAVAAMLLLMGAGFPEESAIETAAASDSAAAMDLMAVELEEEETGFLFVNGEAAKVNYVVLDDTTYVSIVDFVKIMAPDAQVTWTGRGVNINTGKLTMSVELGARYAVANGRYLYLNKTAMLWNDSAMMPIAVLAKAFDAQLSWDHKTETIDLTTGSGALESGDTFYNKDDLYWLSHIIHAESGNQSLSGKIAVGNVIMNRVESRSFPNTIYGVIFQKNQFSPVRNGTINKTPSEDSVIAAKLVLDGAEVMENALYFNQSGLRCWAAKTKTFVATIGNHSFYM